MCPLTEILDKLLQRHEYKYTVYYMPEQASEYIDKKIFKHGIQACPHYDCDFYRFDLNSGVILCRRRIARLAKIGKSYQQIEDCNEFAFPAKFFMGAVQHFGLKAKHNLQLKNEVKMRQEAQDQIDNPPEVNDVSFS